MGFNPSQFLPLYNQNNHIHKVKFLWLLLQENNYLVNESRFIQTIVSSHLLEEQTQREQESWSPVIVTPRRSLTWQSSKIIEFITRTNHGDNFKNKKKYSAELLKIEPCVFSFSKIINLFFYGIIDSSIYGLLHKSFYCKNLKWIDIRQLIKDEEVKSRRIKITNNRINRIDTIQNNIVCLEFNNSEKILTSNLLINTISTELYYWFTDLGKAIISKSIPPPVKPSFCLYPFHIVVKNSNFIKNLSNFIIFLQTEETIDPKYDAFFIEKMPKSASSLFEVNDNSEFTILKLWFPAENNLYEYLFFKKAAYFLKILLYKLPFLSTQIHSYFPSFYLKPDNNLSEFSMDKYLSTSFREVFATCYPTQSI